MARYRKLIGAALGAVTAGAVMIVVEALGLHLDVATATTVAGVLTSLGTLVAPKNDYTA